MHRFSCLFAALLAVVSVAQDTCEEIASRLYLPDPPYDNYLYFDCHSSSHVIVTSPTPESNLTVIGPRLLVAWPAGNSGLVVYFEPTDGANGTLTPSLANSSSTGETLDPIYEPVEGGNPIVGISGSVNFNVPATLTVAVLGSIRTVRDFAEGPSILDPSVQGGIRYSEANGDATIYRTWFDNVTTTVLEFTPLNGSQPVNLDQNSPNTTLQFGAGTYIFRAAFNYPHLEQLNQTEVLNPQSADLVQQQPDQTTSLAFLSYEDKLLAGTWRFLTYFGRDSMISMLLMQPVLSEGENGAIEAVIGAVLERINRTDGTVCHEEVIGDYATYLNLKDNITSTEPRCDYKMIDTDYFLPIALQNYFVDTKTGRNRSVPFFNTTPTFLRENDGLTYETLAEITIQKIMNATAAFAAPGGQVIENLIHLRDTEPVGEWRDSNNGLGGGRIPYDVNAALVPAGLRAIAALSRAGYFAKHPEWNETADRYAQIWEDSTLQFFEISVPYSEAVSLVENYVSDSNLSVPTNTGNITGDVVYYGVALTGTVAPPNNASSSVVPLMNTDDCFRHFFLNTTNQEQLSAFLNQTADHILNPFPVGLASDVGLFVANPAYAGNMSFAANFSRGDYHGTVVWGWQLAMMGAGLGRQLGRCDGDNAPDFCIESELYGKVLSAYDHLWDLIEANSAQLSSEVWSWNYNDGYQATPLGTFVPTESNIRQLWSLTFLAIKRQTFGPDANATGGNVIHRPELNLEELQKFQSQSITLTSAETAIHHAPQVPKKPMAKAFDFFKPKPEGDATPSVPKRILDALSLAGLRRSPKESKPEEETYPPPRKLAVQIVDGKSDAIIRVDVPVYRLMDISAHAKRVLEANPRAARYKIYGKFKPASVCGVVEAITWLQPIPISATLLTVNLFTYEACLRLGISNNRIELKPLLTTIYKQISGQPVDQGIMNFVVDHLGKDDPVFKHMCHVLCWERFVGHELYTKDTAKGVARKRDVQNFMTQIDLDEKSQRVANRTWNRAHKQIRSDRDADADVADESSSRDEKVVEADTVETILDKIAREKETDHEQKETLLSLFKDQETLRLDTDAFEAVEKKAKIEKLE